MFTGFVIGMIVVLGAVIYLFSRGAYLKRKASSLVQSASDIAQKGADKVTDLSRKV